MNRAIVNVASTPYYQRGQARLVKAIPHQELVRFYLHQSEPEGSPKHADIPYAFKAYAMKQAADDGAELLLWCDASILPVKPLYTLWARIERDGYWFSKAGWNNYEWTADSAYHDLFPGTPNAGARELNRSIEHVVATSFGLNVKHPKGAAFLRNYYRLASETRAFCGPWRNESPNLCGPADVRGHRHDQTAASVIAWRLGVELTNPPDVFSYPPGDERTILLADGSYI